MPYDSNVRVSSIRTGIVHLSLAKPKTFLLYSNCCTSGGSRVLASMSRRSTQIVSLGSTSKVSVPPGVSAQFLTKICMSWERDGQRVAAESTIRESSV